MLTTILSFLFHFDKIVNFQVIWICQKQNHPSLCNSDQHYTHMSKLVKRSCLFIVLFNTTNIKGRPAVSGWIQEMLKKYFPNFVWMGVCVKYPPNMYIGAASSQPMKARLCKKREVTYLLHKRYKLT